MKHTKIFFHFSLLIIITLASCQKDKCPYLEKYVYETIVFDEACDCIVSGKVKYLKDCQTVALVDYGDGEM